MTSLKKYFNITGIAIFLITFVVFFMSVERVGSLWDCGEFILGAYKLQVVHPPGAPIFLLIGRLFTWIATVFSDNPSDIAFAVNLMSGISTSLAAVFAGMVTMMFGKIGLVGRDGDTDEGQNIALSLSGLVAGLCTAFASSIWFSAVEGEVYAMSTMFTALTYWAAVKWYYLPDGKDADRWLVLSIFAAGLSIGVHLLSLLTFPAIALLYYYKKYEKRSILGGIAAIVAGFFAIGFVQKVIIVMIPTLWKNLEIFMVNDMGMPVHSGLIPTVLILGALGYLVLRYAHKKGNYMLQLFSVATILVTVAFSTIGTVVIRANADTPVNMNVPSDATRLLPYLNREQYGERALVNGPHYDAKPVKVDREPRYGLVGDKYEIVDEKYSYEYASKDKIFLPRIGHTESSRPALHKMYRQRLTGDTAGKPGFGYNLAFMMKYQVSWMYWRYFMWNFVGRQNGDQGYYYWDKKDGNWLSGITPLDEAKLYNMDKVPDTMANNKANNTYYFLPLIFGLLGLLWHFSRSRLEFVSLLIMFLLTGLGIILYSNQPPNEPRERDYIFAGSFMAFSMWIGMGVLYIYDLLTSKTSMTGLAPAALAGVLALSAPVIMGFQNFDDHSRADITASRDYAANFLNSVAENAILFTYGDNDTYPLWYAQEVEGIRTDVRVVNLSLIAVDWYIDKLRNKVNDSPPLKMTVPQEMYRGKQRNQVHFYNLNNLADQDMRIPMPAKRALEFVANPKNNYGQVQSPDGRVQLVQADPAKKSGMNILNTKQLIIPVDAQKFIDQGVVTGDEPNLTNRIDLVYPKSKSYLLKDDLAILDVISSNINDRPIYFATTCKNDKLQGLNDFMQLEGLALRLIPVKSRSDKSMMIYGSGRADTDEIYDNVMNDWKWGNFDKEDLFVDKNYMAEVQAMKMAILRGAATFSQTGENKKAADLAKKYFEGFPHMNFSYDASIVPFINVLVRSGEYEEAKKHLRILATEANQHMEFYGTLSADEMTSFNQDKEYFLRGIDDALRLSGDVQDPDFAKEMQELLGGYSSVPTRG